jgi:predicted dehydrogenase/threonine dehydrogenase-like Zn-dependent dehydrogenase
MKQIVQDVRSGKTEVVEVPVPVPQPGTVLVKTAVSLVSAGTERMLLEFGSMSMLGKARARPDLVRQTIQKARREGLLNTLHAVQNRLDQPLPMGYSSAGVVLEVGEGVGSHRVGDRVACAGAGASHAEFAVLPEILATPLPAGVDFESASFTTLGAIALHGFRLGHAQLGSHVAVIGLGLLGQLAGEIARCAGCRVLGIDLDPARVEQARRGGFDAVPRQESETAAQVFTGGMGFDCVLICAASSSSDPVELAGELARDRGTVVAVGAVGMEIPRRPFYQKELTVRVSRSYGPGRYDPTYEELGLDYPIGYVRWTEGRNFSAFLNLLEAGSIDVRRLITHRIPIAEAQQAYEILQNPAEKDALAIAITYPTEEPAIDRTVQYFEAVPKARASSVDLGALGAGNFASGVVFPILKKIKGVDLVGVASVNGLRASDAAKKYGFRYATSDPEAILQDEGINTVAILTRHQFHADQATRALQADKHVFCEKPLALDSEQFGQVFQALQASERTLTVGFNRRFAPLAARLKEFLEAAQAPKVVHFRVNAGQLPRDHWLHDPAEGGGRIIGEACHFIDFLLFLTGAFPVEVFTRGLPDVDPYLEDNISISMKFSDGSIGTIDYIAAGDPSIEKEYLEAFSGGRGAKLFDFRRLELSMDGKANTVRSALRQDKGHRGIWLAFVESLLAGGVPPIPYRQIDAVHQATFAALRSLRTGERQFLSPPDSEGAQAREG